MLLNTGKTRAAIGSDVKEYACDESSGRTGDQTEICNCKFHRWCRRLKGHYAKYDGCQLPCQEAAHSRCPLKKYIQDPIHGYHWLGEHINERAS